MNFELKVVCTSVAVVASFALGYAVGFNDGVEKTTAEAVVAIQEVKDACLEGLEEIADYLDVEAENDM